jgi:hypothetical protein
MNIAAERVGESFMELESGDDAAFFVDVAKRHRKGSI